MNQTELIAFDFLKSRYSENSISYQKGHTIRFITNDGKKFVPRKVYGNVVWFYKKQFQQLKNQDNCYLILVKVDYDGTTNVKVIDVREVECGAVVEGIVIRCIEKDVPTEIIQVTKATYNKLLKLKGSRTWDELLEDMARMYERSLHDIDYSGLRNEVLAAIGILMLFKQKRTRELELLTKLTKPMKLDELEPEEKSYLENLLKWKLVTIEGTGKSVICKSVVLGELKMNPQRQELVVYYTRDFCRKYCSLWDECPMKDKGGVRTWKLPLVGELEELIGRVVLDVCG